MDDDLDFIDNGDGTYTDANSGDLYDASGDPVYAVPNQSPLDYQNTTEETPGGLIDTAAGPASPPAGTANGNGFLDGVDALIHGIESGFTNLYTPAVNAGLIQTPGQREAAAAAATAAGADAQIRTAQANAGISTQKMLVFAAAAALILFVVLKKSAP